MRSGNEVRFLNGGGDAGARIRGIDWSASPLGAPSGWPQSLRIAIRLMLDARHPLFIFWGPESVCFFNDAYALMIGAERREGAMGRPGKEVWGEIWDVIGPEIDGVLAGGSATWHEDALIPIVRDGQLQDVYWTYSYGPIDDESAPTNVGGVLVIANETTAKVMGCRSHSVLEADVAVVEAYLNRRNASDEAVDDVERGERAAETLRDRRTSNQLLSIERRLWTPLTTAPISATAILRQEVFGCTDELLGCASQGARDS